MKYWIFEHPQDVSEQEYEKDLSRLPAWRREKTLSYRFLIDRVLCAKAYLLLKQGLLETYGITENVDFNFTASGKPYLKDYPYIHFNLSHCKKGVLCVIHDKPVGCDIEACPEKLNRKLCRYTCCESEVKEILKAEDPCMTFAKIWTRKEAYLKMQGTGLREKLPNLFADGLPASLRMHSETRPECGFAYSVCVQE